MIAISSASKKKHNLDPQFQSHETHLKESKGLERSESNLSRSIRVSSCQDACHPEHRLFPIDHDDQGR